MTHWLLTAFSTYVLHVEHGNGYQWWSGLGAKTLGGALIVSLWWHRVNCHHDGCPWPVRHGKTLCKKHEREQASAQ